MSEAGWYQDPLGLAPLRWWDGSQWTDRVSTSKGPSGEDAVILSRRAVAQIGWRQFAGDLRVAQGGVVFDPVTVRSRDKLANRLIGYLHPAGHAEVIVHTAREIEVIRLHTVAYTTWLVLDDCGAAPGSKSALVALDWQRRGVTVRALNQAGYEVREIRMARRALHNYLDGGAGR